MFIGLLNLLTPSGRIAWCFPRKYPVPGLRTRDWSQVGWRTRRKGRVPEIYSMKWLNCRRFQSPVMNGGYKCLSTMQAGYLNSRG